MGEVSSARFYRPELDVVRFLAFATVFISHAVPSAPSNTTLGAAVRACALGLPLFFCLSAYLITRLLLIERDQTNTVDLRKFYVRRALRIWPLYLSALAVSAAISILHHTIHVTALWYVAALLMLANTVWYIRTTVVHLWSISVEEQFYLLWPITVRTLSYQKVAGGALLLIVSANAALLRFGLMHESHNGRIWHNTFVQMEFFAVGIGLALFNHAFPSLRISVLERLILLGGALAAWFTCVRVCGAVGNPGEFVKGPISLCIGYALAASGCLAILLAVQGLAHWPKPMVYLGKISYGLYVFHAISLSISERFLLRFGRTATFLSALTLTIASAAASYHFFEAYFLSLKQRFEVVQSPSARELPSM